MKLKTMCQVALLTMAVAAAPIAKTMCQVALLTMAVAAVPIAVAEYQKGDHPAVTAFKAGWTVRATLFRAARDIGCLQAESLDRLEKGACDRMAKERARKHEEREARNR